MVLAAMLCGDGVIDAQDQAWLAPWEVVFNRDP